MRPRYRLIWRWPLNATKGLALTWCNCFAVVLYPKLLPVQKFEELFVTLGSCSSGVRKSYDDRFTFPPIRELLCLIWTLTTRLRIATLHSSFFQTHATRP